MEERKDCLQDHWRDFLLALFFFKEFCYLCEGGCGKVKGCWNKSSELLRREKMNGQRARI